MDNTKLVRLLGSDAPENSDYCLIINASATHPEFKYFVTTPIVSEIVIDFTEGELEMFSMKEDWFDNALHPATMTFMNMETGKQDVLDTVNVIGWIDQLVIRGDNMVCQILKNVCLEIQAGRINENALIEALVSVARYLEYKEFPTMTKMFHNLEKMCKEEGLNLDETAMCVSLALDANVQPHDGCKDIFLFDTEQLPTVQSVIEEVKNSTYGI